MWTDVFLAGLAGYVVGIVMLLVAKKRGKSIKGPSYVLLVASLLVVLALGYGGR